MWKRGLSSTLDTLPPLRDVIDRHGLNAKKALGQNFLLDLNITRKIARLADLPDAANMIEIGPGPGGLTRALLMENSGTLTAIEMDARTLPLLAEVTTASKGRLHVVNADALQTNLMAIGDHGNRHIIANLPYNIATPLLIGWLKQIRDHGADAYASITIMVQKEVGQRITAAKGGKTYGRLGILCQWLCHCESVLTLPPQAFTPPPKIDSSVIRLVPKKLDPSAPRFQAVEQITAAAFQQRRKMLRASLKAYAPQLEQCNITPTKRPEELEISDFINLARFIS